MKSKRIIAIALLALLVLIPSAVLADSGEVFGTEYVPDESGTIYAQVLNSDGSPANGATVTLTLWKSDGTKELDGVNMPYIVGTNGIYKYDFTAPSADGVYIADVVTANPTGYGSAEVHVSSEGGGGGASAADIWGEPFIGYTDSSTFGGLFNDITGGGTMPMLFLCGMLALGLMIIFFWKKSQVAAYGAAGVWILLGFQALAQSTSPSPAQIQDTYMGLFWLCVVFTIACILLPLVMREKPSPDDLYVDEVDEVTGEKIPRKEGDDKVKPGQKPSRFSRTGRQ